VNGGRIARSAFERIELERGRSTTLGRVYSVTSGTSSFWIVIAVVLIAAVFAVGVIALSLNRKGNQPAAPDWYPDPYGQASMRYWDGKSGTGYIA
jgi:hypothetical protein